MKLDLHVYCTLAEISDKDFSLLFWLVLGVVLAFLGRVVVSIHWSALFAIVLLAVVVLGCRVHEVFWTDYGSLLRDEKGCWFVFAECTCLIGPLLVTAAVTFLNGSQR